MRWANSPSVDVGPNQKKVVLSHLKGLLVPIPSASDFFSVIALTVITGLLEREVGPHGGRAGWRRSHVLVAGL